MTDNPGQTHFVGDDCPGGHADVTMADPIDAIRERWHRYTLARVTVDNRNALYHAPEDIATLLAELGKRDAEIAHLHDQIDRLASFILSEVPGEPSQNQGAVDTAIRVIRQRDAEIARLRGSVCRHCGANLSDDPGADHDCRTDQDGGQP